MAKTNAKKVVECLCSGDLVRLKAALRADPSAARSVVVVVETGRLGWAAALGLLVKNGADINAAVRGYRALHALIQEKPHSESGGTPPQERVECLKWMLSHGADPEQLGAWPASRAILTAAFAGELAYVKALRQAGAVIDGFVCAALGDLRAVEEILRKDPGFSRACDSAGLTALHCCAGSRLGSKNKKTQQALFAIATLLLDNGADPRATVRSWGQFKQALWLLDRGASPNIPDERGWTAVHQAASRGNEKMLKALLDAGGDSNRRDDVGNTPVDIAGDRSRPKISALLAGTPTVPEGNDKRI